MGTCLAVGVAAHCDVALRRHRDLGERGQCLQVASQGNEHLVHIPASGTVKAMHTGVRACLCVCHFLWIFF